MKRNDYWRNYQKKKPDFRFSQLGKLEELFIKKKWPIKDKDEERSLFGKYEKMLSQLTVCQQDFIIKLTENFIWIKGDEYIKCLIDVVKQVRESVGDKIIYFAPCKPISDKGLIKSSDYVWYSLRDNIFRYEMDLGKIEMINGLEDVNQKLLLNDKAVLVLVDDFIGSGGTACKALVSIYKLYQNLYQRKPYNGSIKVLAIVVQEVGLKELEDVGVEVFYSKIAKRGIADQDTTEEEKKRMYDMMKQIEIPILKDKYERYHCGYAQSEALVSMIRCPNNTFPIYWFFSEKSPYARFK